MIDETYWRDYYSSWDGFVKNWYQSQINNLRHEQVALDYQSFVNDLNLSELPEPYYGRPDKGVDAVIINLNPGMTDPNERAKILSGNGHPDGWLIDAFKSCNCSYRQYADQWSSLDSRLCNHAPRVPGVLWWMENRMPWLRQIYQKPGLQPERVFALELCPYHSREFRFRGRREGLNTLGQFITKHVINPAAKAVEENNLKFAVAVGKQPMVSILSQIGARCIKEWSYRDNIEGWPTCGFRNRTYRLYGVEVPNGQVAYIIVTWAQAYGLGLPAPEIGECGFKAVEKQIYNFVDNLAIKTGRMVEKPSQALPILPGRQQRSGLVTTVSRTLCSKKQAYKMLWCGFCNWCNQHNKLWFTVTITSDCNTNSIHPSGGGNPHLFFKVANGQLYLGIYCTVSMYEGIQTRCAEEINAVYDDVDWTNGEDNKTWRSILIPINEDWRNPNEALFEKMSDAFERVGSILKRHGFNIMM